MNTVTEQFRQAIVAVGLEPPNHIDPGREFRFPGLGKSSKNRAGWGFMFDDMRGGTFGDFSSGLESNWQAANAKPYTDAEREANQARFRAVQAERAEAEKVKHNNAAVMAAKIWDAAAPITEASQHAYLMKKGIQPHGARLIQSQLARELCPLGNLSPKLTGSLLVIPIFNAEMKLRSLQFVTEADGDNKRPLTGGEKKGCFYLLESGEATKIILIVGEGFATCASVQEATGQTVAMAIDSSNLEPACKALRKANPDTSLVIGADDDWRNKDNTGMLAARSAAMAVGGKVVAPQFPTDRPDGATDFNDLHKLAGLDVVKACFAEAIAEAQEDDATPVANTDAKSDTGANPFPDIDDRPRYVVLDDWLELADRKHKPGVYYCGIKASKGETPPESFDQWICSPLHVDAVTFDGQSNNFGRLLRFRPTFGKWREWALPMELLAGDGSVMRSELLAMGVELEPQGNARQQLSAYLQSEHPKRRVHCALQVGWCGDAFVLPDAVIGTKADGVIFQSGERGHEEHTKAGTLDGWKSEIAAKAVGNPLLMLSLSAAFSGPLLSRCNSEGGGLHLFGDSSTGKSTLLEAACSVWGGPRYKRSWRATSNGLEGAAAMFNDSLLALDEISECDPAKVGEIIYMIGNGRGKQRAGRSGNARGVTSWRCMVVSNGERTIATTMQEGGHRVKAGQGMRLLDIPAAQRYGAFDTLHGAVGGAALSDSLKRAAAAHHGYVGRAFLERLTRDKTDYCTTLEEVKALPMFATDSAEGQDKRSMARFALIGMAGELATEYGLTGWTEGAALDAAVLAFKLWSGLRGKGNDERRQILEQVSGFLERHGDGRFSDSDSASTSLVIRDRAGWWRDTDAGRVYLLTADGMREAVKGFEFRHSLLVLHAAGALPSPNYKGEHAKAHRIAGRSMKLYQINPEKLAV